MTTVPPGPVGLPTVPATVFGTQVPVPWSPTIHIIAALRRPNFIRRLPPKVIHADLAPRWCRSTIESATTRATRSARCCGGGRLEPIGEPKGMLPTIVRKSNPAWPTTTLRDQEFRFLLVQGTPCDAYFATERL